METLAGDSTSTTLDSDPASETLGLVSTEIPEEDATVVALDSALDGGVSKTLASGDFDAKTLAFDELDGDEGGGVGDEDVKGGNLGRFVAGDLIWGRIKGKQLWPGRIVDPSSGADCAAKADGEGKDGEALLVSYFGGLGYGWCPVTQLEPFVEAFGKMIKQNKGKSFVLAVNEAVEELRLCVEVKMICECLPAEAFPRGVIADGKQEEPLKPMEFVKLLHSAACDVMAVNSVEVALLKSWVIAFGKGWSNGLPGYQVRREIEELVDKVDLDVLPGELAEEKEVEKDGTSVGARARGKHSLSKDKSKKSNVKKKSVRKLITEMPLDTVELNNGENLKVEENKVSKKRSGKCKPVDDHGKYLGVEYSDDVKTEEETASSKRERKRSKYLSPPYTNLVAREINSLPSPKSADVKPESATTEMEEDTTSALLKLDSTSAYDILLGLRYTALDPLYLKRSKLAKTVRAFFTQYRISMYSSGSDFAKCQNEPSESCGKHTKSPGGVSANGPGQGKSEVKNSKRKNRSKDNPEAALSPDSVKSSQKSKAVRKRKLTGNEAESKKSKVIEPHIIDVPVVSRYEKTNRKDRNHKENPVLCPEPINSKQPVDGGIEVLKGKETSNGSSGVVHGGSGRVKVGKSGPKKKKKSAAAPNVTQMDLGEIQRTDVDSIENRYPGALLMNFSAGVSLPTRDELISTFRKYGVMIESETELQQETGFARLVFAKSTDAERAYNSSDKTGVFCPPQVTYRLRYLPPVASSPTATPHQKPPLPFIRENLERMISTLTSAASPLKDASSTEGLKSETKENLVGDMEGLLKKVNMMLNGHSAGSSS